MSPRIIFLLTLTGVILAGVPLLHLTSKTAPAPAVQQAEDAVRKTVYTTVRFTGTPMNLRLRCAKNTDWQQIDSSAGSQHELELSMPLSGMVEIELQAEWPDAAAPQAVTLTLEPDGYDTRTATEWKEEGLQKLHSIFRFSW